MYIFYILKSLYIKKGNTYGKKYSLTNDKKNIGGHTVYRIIAEKDFNGVKKGTFGGYVETDVNLSHTGNCWIYGNASVYDDAKVYGNAHVYGFCLVYGNVHVYDDAEVYGNAWVYENAKVYGNAHVYENGVVSQNMWVNSASVSCSLEKNILESIRCQTGLGVFNNKVIAYKQTHKDLSSFYDKYFKYEIGKTIEVENPDMTKISCSTGLHFSTMNYWNYTVGADTCYLMAEIDLDDIITVQQGKIRCKKAKILGVYNIQ